MDIREAKLREQIMADAASRLNDALLDICADQEVRLCYLELGINPQ